MSELFISGAVLIDPEAAQPFEADVLIRDGVIADIGHSGSISCSDNAQTLDARGLYLCPGFIDPHSHIDGHAYTAQLSLLQGITTAVGGNCGFSPLHIGEFLSRQHGFPIHQAELIGMCALREAAGVSDPFAPADEQQAAVMGQMARSALLEGASGVSLGPAYTPGASMQEMIVLCRAAKDAGRPVSIDTRMHSMTDLNSLQEAIDLAAVSGCRMVVSHFVYQYGVGVEEEALSMLEKARARGVDIHLDSGMYKDWCSSIGSALFEPEVMRENGIELHHLRVITGEHIGVVPDQALYEHLRSDHPHDAVSVNTGDQEAVYTIARCPLTMISTDAGAYAPREGHPQIAGSFPRFLREMVRERGEMTWNEAIRHITLLPAQVFSFAGKGRLRPGFDADLVLFDPKTIADRADFPGLGCPNLSPAGLVHVIVCGRLAVKDGALTGVNAGNPIAR